jgi:Eukaryotic aspartyl protease
VILDTGSSALVLDGKKYEPAKSDKRTKLAQSDSYDDSSWVGAVIGTTVSVGEGANSATLDGVNVAVAYHESGDVFGPTDGVLGLAYASLDRAFEMSAETWPKRYTDSQIRDGRKTHIIPYLTQLADADVVSDKISFYTQRSSVHHGGGGAKDPLNKGWMIVGGGEESTDLYTGVFQTVKVLADEWYSTNLKAVKVGNTPAIPVHARGAMGTASNSIIDSGTNSLDLGPHLLELILSKFNATHRAMLSSSIHRNRSVAMTRLDLGTWPDITFILQGDNADASLTVSPNEYWQVNAPEVGAASAAITVGDNGQHVLGLPLMNGYFTIFDGEADGGKGVVKFATRK